MTQPKTASKFTPGPWYWVEVRETSVLSQKGGYTNILAHKHGEDSAHYEITPPDARLIAKAPEMYELLRHILTADGIPRSIAPGPMSQKDAAWLRTVYDEARRIKAEIDGKV